jgi:hypothetical protein
MIFLDEPDIDTMPRPLFRVFSAAFADAFFTAASIRHGSPPPDVCKHIINTSFVATKMEQLF